MEPNPSAINANSLGQAVDEDGADIPLDDLVVRDSADEDWFKIDIVDEPGFVNPALLVELDQDARVHDLDVFFTCGEGSDASSCIGLPESNEGFGTHCEGVGDDPSALILTSCSDTSDESGTAWIRVRRTSWDDTCRSYSLRVYLNL